ncbi:MAG: O-antigen ligase family protein [Phycisphaerales bacterium]|nr:O-antigen ligase family protein [Phycisphaerales bacterium]
MGPMIYNPTALVLLAVAYILALLVVLRWPSVGVALVLAVPVTKSLIQMRVGPILQDYTFDVGVAILAIVGALIHRLRSGTANYAPVPVFIIIAWFVIAALMWVMLPMSRSPDYGFKKATIFSIYNTMAVTAVVLYVVSAHEVRALMRVIVAIGIVVSASMPLFGVGLYRVEGARQTLGLVNPLAIADFSSWAALILISGLIQFGGVGRLVGLVLFAPLSILAIFLSQTRFPLFAVPVILLVMLWMYRHRINFRVASSIVIGLGAVAWVASLLITPTRGGDRFSTGAIQAGLDVRAQMFRMTMHGFLRSPVLGNGTGDTSFQLTGSPTEERYPHNSLIEIANELGAIGAAAWLTIFIYALVVGWRFQRVARIAKPGTYFALVTAYALMLYTFMGSFKAGGYFGLASMYMAVMMVIALHVALRRELERYRMAPTAIPVPAGGFRVAGAVTA